ncbi:Cadmium/zinc-transporting ATPase HMA2 [Linum grandiflorum]
MAEPEKTKLQKSYFDVLGLCCSSEVPLVENILKSLDGVKDVSVVVPTKTVIVVHDANLVSQLQIVKALNQARLEANVRLDGGSGGANYRKRWPSPYAIGSGILLLLSFLKYVYPPMKWVAIGAVVVGVPPILLKAIASIRNARLDVTTLVLVAVISTVAMKDYTEAATVVFLFTIADWLESRASNKASAVMTSLMSIAPQKATIAESGEEVDVDEVKLNTVVVVKAGEAIPIDGIVVDGQCEVDEKSLTGESFPVSKQKDSAVWAGTLNLNGYVTVRTTALAEDCVVAKMAKLVEEAQNSKSSTQRFIDRCAQYYTPAIILISASFAVVPLAMRVHNRNHWFHLALVVLVSACPCALVLSTPVATFCALTKAATAGLLIKGGDYLETLAKVKVVAFDKTGTITRGDFVVSDFKSVCDDFTSETLIYWVSSIESKSSHPMAAALVDYGRSRSIEPRPENVEEYENIPGEGIHARIDGRDIYIGNKKIAVRAGSETVPMAEGDGGMTIGYVYYGGTLVGVFSLADSCRTGVKEAIRELKSMGIRTAMLTGDSQAAAMNAQTQLENALEEVHAELLPEDKARIVGEFKRRSGRTAMVGDGINDAPALATADIGISMGVSGSALATETGNVILMSNDIRKVPQAIKLARKAHRKVIENVVFSICTKSSILALAFAGHPLIWAAVLADVGTCVLVILNSMLLLRGTHKHGAKSATHNHKHKDHHHHHGKGNCSSEKKKCCSSEHQHHHTAKPCKDSKCGKSAGCGGNNATEDSKHCDKEQVNSLHNHGCSETHKHSLCTGKEHHETASSEEAYRSCKKDDTFLEQEHVHHHHHCKKDETLLEQEHVHHHHCKKDETILEQEHVHHHHHHHHQVDHHGSMENNKDCNFVHHDHHDIPHAESTCCSTLEQKPGKEPAKKCCESNGDPSERMSCKPVSSHSHSHPCSTEIDGCCKSYRKECCRRNGGYPPGLGGRLTEIVIE